MEVKTITILFSVDFPPTKYKHVNIRITSLFPSTLLFLSLSLIGEGKKEKNRQMGVGSSRVASGSGPSHRRRRLRRTIKRTVSSLLLCGASSSTQIADYPAELLVNSAEHDKRERLKCLRKDSGLSPGIGKVSVGTADKGKLLSESREIFPLRQFIANSRGNETASTSYVDQPSPDCGSATEMVIMDAVNGSNMNGYSSQVVVGLSSSSSLTSHGLGESLLDEVLAENNFSDEVIPSDLGFLVSGEENRRDESRLPVDVMGVSSNSNSAEARRNSRGLFWDAFSRHSSRRHIDSRALVISSADFFPDEVGGDFSSYGSNEQQRSSRSSILNTLRDGLDSTDNRTAVCSRGIHDGGSCSCLSSLSAEDSSARAGISRIVLLAEALFEVLDQIHRLPMTLSLSMLSLPAPESVVDTFTVKTRTKIESLECADDVSRCHICLDEYEEGDKIRVLPCQHEYHMSCVDKWLKEIHGVCPLCRRDVCESPTEASVSY